MSDVNRTIVVTGAAGHLGRAVAAAFREQGARLVLVDRQADALAAAYGSWAGTWCAPVDLLDAQATQAGLGAALAQVGRIDAICHLVGGFRMGDPVHALPLQSWDFLLELNARTLLNVAHALVPHLIERGRGQVVTVGAAAAVRGVAGMGAYCASKSALVRLTEAMSAELREQGINVNCVLPSIIDTPDNRRAMPDADFTRWVAPRALADVIAFLASDAARAIHGAAIPVTGLV